MERLEIAKGLMLEFAKETGLEPASHQRRYLWTDAFAVCAFFELYRKTADPSFKGLPSDSSIRCTGSLEDTGAMMKGRVG